MSFFNFFRSNKSSIQTSVGAIPDEPVVAVDRQLFIEESAPEGNPSVKKTISPVEEFLDEKFEWQGYNDGYSHPEMEYLMNKLAMIRSQFRLAIDKCMDSRRSEVGELKLHLIDITGISPRLEAKLKEKISQLEVLIHELDTQKILSIEDEGMVAPAIHAYRIGFVRGLERYQQEKLFAGSTGLFHQ